MIADTTDLADHGQIERMSLPDGWSEVEVVRHPFDLWYMREFRPDGEDEVRLSFYYRGGPVADASAESFKSVLSSGLHSLSEDELWSIQQVLRDFALADEFTVGTAEVIDLNGRVVLSIQGSWPKIARDSWGIFIDADGTGSQVQEIHFIAPADLYASLMPSVRSSLATIKWK